MKHQFQSYSTVIFDCDGVVLDSNTVKTKAFHDTVIEFGEDAAKELVEYHRRNGGISRYKKFEYFLSHIAPGLSVSVTLSHLVDTYAKLVIDGLLRSKVEPSLMDLRKRFPDARWLIASGGAEEELRWVFEQKKLDSLFEGGIFGSPDTKEEILSREIERGNIMRPALFIGDSRYDYVASDKFDLDFVFISQWTEFSEWEQFCKENEIFSCQGLKDLIL